MNHKGLAAMLSVALIIIPIAGAEAQSSPAALKAFPDFLSVRSEFLSAVITAAPARALAFKPAFRDTPAGRVRVSVERSGGSFFVLFQRERDGEFPVGSRGNVVIKRDAATGYVTRVVWFLSDDGKSFISLTPKNERTIVDYVVAGGLVRGGYSVSRLIYYFFTNTFSYLHDATRSGLDWSLVLGAPVSGTAESFAAELLAGKASGSPAELVSAAVDFTNVGRYLGAAGHAVSVPEEVSAQPFTKSATFVDPRDPAFKALPGWSEANGLPIEAAPAILVAGLASESAYIALLGGSGTESPARLAVVPYREANGSYTIAAVDAATRKPVDFPLLVSGSSGATMRLFRVPLPNSR